MNLSRRHAFVLAIYLNTRGFGFVLFEGHLSPVDWGVKELRGPGKHRRSLAGIVTILDRYLPAVLVIQNTSLNGTTRAGRITKLNAAVAEIAEGRGILVHAYSRADVQRAFAYLGVPNKQSLAEMIANHIPAFERYVPPPRKPWMSEDTRMGIFDAAALALTFFQDGAGESRS
jgi:Holliday junction resolvasome RuvABC endonuclease subunit